MWGRCYLWPVSARLTTPNPSGRLRRLCGLVRGDAPPGRSAAPEERLKILVGGGEHRLAEVRVGENETFESALRRFNKKIQQSGILAEAQIGRASCRERV